MARIIILGRDYPADLSSGLHLRVHHLCRELAREHRCFFVNLSGRDPGPEALADGPFEEIVTLAPPPVRGRSWRRHYRLSNAHRLQQSFPDYFHGTVRRVREQSTRWQADVAVSFAAGMAEIALALPIVRLNDVPDCFTLSTERMLRNRGREMTLARRCLLRLELLRRRAGEGELVRGFDATMSISEPDRRRLLELSGVDPARVTLIPNGVAPEALAMWRDHTPTPRSVVFWGNLDFPPNWTAVRFFHDEIYLPHLAERGVAWHIVGRNAGPGIQRIAKHPGIHLTGFQPDLFRYIADKGVMINPMVEGSGLKNKVLEAFAVGLPVVSTALGIDALPVATGTDCLVADEPTRFAEAVLTLIEDPALTRRICDAARQRVTQAYTWDVVGRSFSALVSGLAERGAAVAETRG